MSYVLYLLGFFLTVVLVLTLSFPDLRRDASSLVYIALAVYLILVLRRFNDHD